MEPGLCTLSPFSQPHTVSQIATYPSDQKFSLSLLWAIANLVVLLKRSRWIHPGANVGCDLILWLIFFGTALCSTGGAVGLLSPYDDSSSHSSSPGRVTLQNGTTYETPRSCSGFESCEQEENYKHDIQVRGIVVAVASALAWIMLLVHFALFVSACRYTHQRRREGREVTPDKLKKAEMEIEERVIKKLEQEGRLMPATLQRPEQAGEVKGMAGAPPQTRTQGAHEEMREAPPLPERRTESAHEQPAENRDHGSWPMPKRRLDDARDVAGESAPSPISRHDSRRRSVGPPPGSWRDV